MDDVIAIVVKKSLHYLIAVAVVVVVVVVAVMSDSQWLSTFFDYLIHQ